MSSESVDTSAVRTALDRVEWPYAQTSVSDITEIEGGVNDVYTFSTGLDDPKRAVCKFATFSESVAFQAGVAAARQIASHTEIPVPELYAFRTDPEDLPAFQVMEFLPGDPLPSHPTPDARGPARALGRVIRELGAIPAERTSGYGWVQANSLESADSVSAGACLEGEYTSCREWLLQYGLTLYDSRPAHDELAAAAQAVPAFLRENSDRFPADPPISIVLTDFGPRNLLAPGGTVSSDGTLAELTGLLDLERAKLGPTEFNAVNAEFLMQRWIDNPEPVINALYDPLPFGPDLPRRDIYRLLAMGREVNGLDLFYEVGGEKHEHRGTELAREIDRIVAE